MHAESLPQHKGTHFHLQVDTVGTEKNAKKVVWVFFLNYPFQFCTRAKMECGISPVQRYTQPPPSPLPSTTILTTHDYLTGLWVGLQVYIESAPKGIPPVSPAHPLVTLATP